MPMPSGDKREKLMYWALIVIGAVVLGWFILAPPAFLRPSAGYNQSCQGWRQGFCQEGEPLSDPNGGRGYGYADEPPPPPGGWDPRWGMPPPPPPPPYRYRDERGRYWEPR